MIVSLYKQQLLATLSVLILLAGTTAYAAAQNNENNSIQAQPSEDCPQPPFESSNPLSGNCEAIEAGRKLYPMFCSACHGGNADGWGGPSLGERYAADLTKHWSGYQGYMKAVLDGKKGRIGLMPPWRGVLTEEQINQLGAFLETLAVEGAYWR